MTPWWADGDVNTCTACGKRKPHTIRRINRPRAPVLCDECATQPKKGK